MGRYVLAYDSDCGPCTRFRRAVGFLDTRHRIGFVPLDRADREGLLERVPAEMRHRSFHLVLPDQEALSGARALPELIRLLPAGTFLSRLIVGAPLGYQSMAFVYSVFARLHDTGSCSYPGSRDAAKQKTREAAAKAAPLGLGAISVV